MNKDKVRKINSAPKDGSEILLYNGAYWEIGYWAKRGESDLNRGAWLDRSSFEIHRPLIWCALPPIIS